MLLLYTFFAYVLSEKITQRGPAERLIYKLLIKNKYDNNVRPM